MTHQDQLPTRAAPAAGRRIIIDPEAVGKIQRKCDATALAESEIKAALAKARCGIVRHDVLYVASNGRYHVHPLHRLLHAVAAATGVPLHELVGQRREERVARARMIFYALAKEISGHSLPAIGRVIGKRDHSTLIHGIRKVARCPAYFEPELTTLREAFTPGDDTP